MPEMRWNKEKIRQLFEIPFIKVIHQASDIHLQHHAADEMELCSLLSIKTGACPEDCAYCPQSGHYQTYVKKENLMQLNSVIAQAKNAKSNGAKRFCMGAAWRNPPKKDFLKVLEIIKAVKQLGLETCVTLGSLNEEQAHSLHEAGLDFYNHNLDTSPEFYSHIITTRTYADRLKTLNHVQACGINICCGGILGMGESQEDRISLLEQLANLPQPPKSIPINRLISIKGTPLENANKIENIEFVRMLAATRIVIPRAIIRLSAGREDMSEEMQALCFIAGANSIWLGEKLLTADNPKQEHDIALLKTLGFKTPCHA